MLPKSSLRRTRENVRLASSTVDLNGQLDTPPHGVLHHTFALQGRTDSFGNAIQNAELAASTWTELTDIHPHAADCTLLASPVHHDLE